MDEVEEYRQIIKNILTDYIAIPYKYQNVKSKLIVSEDRNDYMIVVWGTHDTESVHQCIVHVEICDDKIHIRRQHERYDIYTKLPYTIPQYAYISYDYAYQPSIDFAVSLEKIYQVHESIFVLKSEPESDYGQPKIKSDATSTELTQLAEIGHDFINNEIAQHPNTPPDLLIKLFSKFSIQVLTNPNLDLLLVEYPGFLEQLYDSFSNSLYKNYVSLPAFFIEWAANHKRKDIRAKVANSHQISISLIEKLIEDDSCEVVNSLYENYTIKGELKEQMEKRRLQFIDNCQKRKNYECECNGQYLPF